MTVDQLKPNQVQRGLDLPEPIEVIIMLPSNALAANPAISGVSTLSRMDIAPPSADLQCGCEMAPSEKDTETASLKKRLWDAADQLRTNSGLKSQECFVSVLRFAEVRLAAQRASLEKASACRGSGLDQPAANDAEGILYLPPEARFDYLLNRPGAENIGAKVNAAMRDNEKDNPQLPGVLPKTYTLFTSTLPKELLNKVSEIPASLDSDAFGRMYEYFLDEFPISEGQGGGFHTTSSIARLLIKVIESYHGRIFETLRLDNPRRRNPP